MERDKEKDEKAVIITQKNFIGIHPHDPSLLVLTLLETDALNETKRNEVDDEATYSFSSMASTPSRRRYPSLLRCPRSSRNEGR